MSGSRRPSIAERKSSFGSLSRRRPSTSSNLVERKAASMVDVYHADPAKDETKAASPSSFSFSSEGGTLLGADLKVSPVSEPPEMPMISESVQARKRSWASDLALDLSDLHISDPGRHKRSPSDTFRISKPGAGGFVRDRVLPYADDGPDDALPPLRNRRRASSAAELTYNWGR